MLLEKISLLSLLIHITTKTTLIKLIMLVSMEMAYKI